MNLSKKGFGNNKRSEKVSCLLISSMTLKGKCCCIVFLCEFCYTLHVCISFLPRFCQFLRQVFFTLNVFISLLLDITQDEAVDLLKKCIDEVGSIIFIVQGYGVEHHF